MSITNQFNYYVRQTKKYHQEICNAVDKIIYDSPNPNNCFIDNYDFHEIVKSIFNSLPRVINAANSYHCITANDIMDKNDEITIIFNKIADYILDSFKNKNYKIERLETPGLDGGGLNFKKTR